MHDVRPGITFPSRRRRARISAACGDGDATGAGAGQCILCPPGQYGDKEAMAGVSAGTFNPDAGAKIIRRVSTAPSVPQRVPGKGAVFAVPGGNVRKPDGDARVLEVRAGNVHPFEGPSSCRIARAPWVTRRGSRRGCDPCPLGTTTNSRGGPSAAVPAEDVRPGGGRIPWRMQYCPRWHFNSGIDQGAGLCIRRRREGGRRRSAASRRVRVRRRRARPRRVRRGDSRRVNNGAPRATTQDASREAQYVRASAAVDDAIRVVV